MSRVPYRGDETKRIWCSLRLLPPALLLCFSAVAQSIPDKLSSNQKRIDSITDKVDKATYSTAYVGYVLGRGGADIMQFDVCIKAIQKGDLEPFYKWSDAITKPTTNSEMVVSTNVPTIWLTNIWATNRITR